MILDVYVHKIFNRNIINVQVNVSLFGRAQAAAPQAVAPGMNNAPPAPPPAAFHPSPSPSGGDPGTQIAAGQQPNAWVTAPGVGRGVRKPNAMSVLPGMFQTCQI